ncbi:MAG: hypothetical protein HZB92_08935 [Euryarchaeota archaeon]|nr:hypothetical protein [Euryarchaeota archaeon]
MDAPSSITYLCPGCGTETNHRVLKGKMWKGKDVRVEATTKCAECGLVHNVNITEEAPIAIPTVVSWKGGSEKIRIDLLPADEVCVGDEIQHDTNLLVTAIDAGPKRVPASMARDITTLWTKRFDTVEVNFSIARGSRTVSASVDAHPDEEFEIGQITDVGGKRIVIHRIKTQESLLYHGVALARDIVRVYGRIVRERSH